MDPKEKEEYFFQAADKYKFLSCGNLAVAGINDAQEYEDTKEAMNIMGMSEDERSGEKERQRGGEGGDTERQR